MLFGSSLLLGTLFAAGFVLFVSMHPFSFAVAVQIQEETNDVVQKSIILANLDQYTEAIGELKNALKIDRAYAEAYFHLGNLYLMTGEQALGLESYNKAIANGFDDSQIFFNLGLMYEEDGNDELAIRNYTKAILKDPLRVDARVRKAKIFIANGKQQEALETLDELILADPDLYDGYHLKALLLADMGNLRNR